MSPKPKVITENSIRLNLYVTPEVIEDLQVLRLLMNTNSINQTVNYAIKYIFENDEKLMLAKTKLLEMRKKV